MKFLMGIFLSFGASFGWAAQAPRSLTLGMSEASTHALGGVCFATDVGGEALPCNPAFTAREVPTNFRAQFFFGNNISYLREVSDLLAGDGDQESVRRLFSQSRGAEMEANLEAGYRRPTFGLAFSPYRLTYYSLLRDRSLPVVTLLAAQERTLRMQFAGYAGQDWSWGVQMRGVNRKFIAQEFTLADALTEQGRSLFEPETQNAFYVEPGLLKEWPDEPVRPQVTMAIRNLGAVDRKSEAFPTSPEFHFGGSVQPRVSVGELGVGIDLAFHSQTQQWNEPIKVGSAYQIGVTRYSVSVGRSEHAAGFELLYKNLNGGLTYTSRWIENLLGENEWVRTVYLHCGFSI